MLDDSQNEQQHHCSAARQHIFPESCTKAYTRGSPDRCGSGKTLRAIVISAHSNDSRSKEPDAYRDGLNESEGLDAYRAPLISWKITGNADSDRHEQA